MSQLDLGGGFHIETPEQVSFRLERAGLGSRILAACIDTLILAALYMVLLVGLFVAMGAAGLLGEEHAIWFLGLAIIVVTFLMWGYYIGFELAWNGQTPGKRALNIRVVGDAGVPARPQQILVRNLVRVIDLQLGYAVGIVAIFASSEEKRLGDLAAGTIVVNERRRPLQPAVPTTPSARGRDLDGELLDVVRDFWRRAPQLEPGARARIAEDLADRLAASLGNPPVGGYGAEARLRELTDLVFDDVPAAPGFAAPGEKDDRPAV